MDHYSRIVHIDFCFRAQKEMVPKFNHPKGYWYITEISGTNGGTVWHKSVIGEWNRIAHKYLSAEEDEAAIKNGALKKSLHHITAAGFVHNRLDGLLIQHMEKENKTEYPYNYWQNRDWEKSDFNDECGY